MNQKTSTDQIREFAKQTAMESKRFIRQCFKEFKEKSFPNAKKDNLDHNTVCEIEDEFRKQEESILENIDTAFSEYIDQSEQWLRKYENLLSGYTKISVVAASGFISAIQAHHFTYWSLVDYYPHPKMVEIFQEGDIAHKKMLEKQGIRLERLRIVFQKKSKNLFAENKAVEHSYQSKINALVDVVLPASHKQIENLIQQNYLQRMGALHGLN